MLSFPKRAGWVIYEVQSILRQSFQPQAMNKESAVTSSVVLSHYFISRST